VPAAWSVPSGGADVEVRRAVAVAATRVDGTARVGTVLRGTTPGADGWYFGGGFLLVHMSHLNSNLTV
jgi:hypothetical protein